MTELEQRAERFTLSQPPAVVIKDHSYFLPSDIKNTYVEATKQETNYLSKHILELIDDKGKLTDQVNDLMKQISFLEDNLRVVRKDRENLQLQIGNGLKEFIKDCPFTSLKFFADSVYVEQLCEVKQILQKVLTVAKCCDFLDKEDEEIISKAEDLLKEQDK